MPPTRAYVPCGNGTVFRIDPQCKKPQGFLNFNITDRENFLYRAEPAGLALDQPYSSGHIQQENCVMLL